MNLSSYEFEIISLYCKGPFAFAKDLLIGAKNNHKIWTCFLLFKPSPNAFKFCMSFNTKEKGHVSNHSKIFLHAFIETFLHD